MLYTYDENLISDLHKAAYGIRPTATFRECWYAMTPLQKQYEWEYLCKLVDEKEEVA